MMARKRPDGKWAPTGDYDVGFAQPPKQNQFKKGGTSPRKGSSTGTLSKRKHLATLLSEPVVVRINGREVRVPFSEAFIQMTKHKALGGDMRAMRIVDAWIRELGLVDPEVVSRPPEPRFVVQFVDKDKDGNWVLDGSEGPYETDEK